MAAVVLTVICALAALVTMVAGLGCMASGLHALAAANLAVSLGCWVLACVNATKATQP